MRQDCRITTEKSCRIIRLVSIQRVDFAYMEASYDDTPAQLLRHSRLLDVVRAQMRPQHLNLNVHHWGLPADFPAK